MADTSGVPPPVIPPLAPVPSLNPPRCRDVWSTDAGPVIVETPAKLTAADVEDLETFLRLVLRGIRRRAGLPVEEP